MIDRKYVLYMPDPVGHNRYFIKTLAKGNLYVEFGTKEDAQKFDAVNAIYYFNYYRPVLTTLQILEI